MTNKSVDQIGILVSLVSILDANLPNEGFKLIIKFESISIGRQSPKFVLSLVKSRILFSTCGIKLQSQEIFKTGNDFKVLYLHDKVHRHNKVASYQKEIDG